jgi:hypothetical protein
MVVRLTWETPPDHDDPVVPSRAEIAAALSKRVGRWAVVGRHDRAARAEAHAERINSGKEYGAGFVAVHRRVGPEHRVFARSAESNGLPA